MSFRLSSFAQIVKEEIIAKPYTDERLLAIITSFIKLKGHYVIKNKKSLLTIKIENPKISKFIYLTINKLFQVNGTFLYSQNTRFNKKTTYHLQVEDRVDEILEAIGLSFTSNTKTEKLFKTEDEIAGYLSGVFLASGSVNSPESSNYHLEMSSHDEEFLVSIQKLIEKNKRLNVNTKMTIRRQRYVLYLKKSDQIANFLIYLGATEATLEYENIRIARDFNNSDNRWQICETSNMKKVIESAHKQVEMINFLKNTIKLENLPNEKMTLLAKLRLEDEGTSMNDLADLMSEELNTQISKSNVNHLFRAMKLIAERYGYTV